MTRRNLLWTVTVCALAVLAMAGTVVASLPTPLGTGVMHVKQNTQVPTASLGAVGQALYVCDAGAGDADICWLYPEAGGGGVGFDASAAGQCVVGGDGGGTVACETTIPLSVVPSGIPLSDLALSNSGYCAVLSDGGAAGGYCGTVPASAMAPFTLTTDVTCTSSSGTCAASAVSATGTGSTTDNGATGATFSVKAVAAKLASSSTTPAETTVNHVVISQTGTWTTVYGPYYPAAGSNLHCNLTHDGYDRSGLPDGGIAFDGGGTADGGYGTHNQFHGQTEFTVDQVNGVQSLTAGGGTPSGITDGGCTLGFVPSTSCSGCTTTTGTTGCSWTSGFAPQAQALLTDGGVVVQLLLPTATVASAPWWDTVTSDCNVGP